MEGAASVATAWNTPASDALTFESTSPQPASSSLDAPPYRVRFGSEAATRPYLRRVRFSNRPVGVKRFQTIHRSSVDVSRGLALLRNRHKGPSIMGFEDEVEQSLPRPCHQTDDRSKRTHELTSSIVPRGTSFHRSVELEFLLSHSILHGPHAAATSRVQRNSVPSTQMRCMITANRRASATIASLIGRLGSSAFRLSTVPVSMSLAGSRFSSESAQGPFHHGVRGRGGTIFTAALPSNRRQIQADTRTHLIHRPARDIIPPLGGARVPPIAFDPARSSCRCDVSGPAELGAVNPDAVHDHGQPACQRDDCFSNRPVGVKRFQTIHRSSVDVSRGLALLFGIGTRALPSWGSRTRWNNLYRGLAIKQTTDPSGHTNSPHPSSREGHHSTARWSSSSSYRIRSCTVLMPLRRLGSSGTRCRQPRCGA